MSIEYEVVKREQYLVVIPDDVVEEPAELMAFIEECLDKSNRLGLDRILLDNRKLAVQMEHAGAFEVANRCVELMSSIDTLRVALVSRPERMEFARIYETIGFNRGVQIKAFESLELAASWLCL